MLKPPVAITHVTPLLLEGSTATENSGLIAYPIRVDAVEEAAIGAGL